MVNEYIKENKASGAHKNQIKKHAINKTKQDKNILQKLSPSNQKEEKWQIKRRKRNILI